MQSSVSGTSSSPGKPDSREKLNLAKDSTIKDSYKSDDKSEAFRIDDCIKMQINDQNHKVHEKVAVGNKKHDASVDDLHLVAVYTKPIPSLKNLQTLLICLNLKKYCVKGDGSCLYHAVAHQAGLITTYSKGDDMVSV